MEGGRVSSQFFFSLYVEIEWFPYLGCSRNLHNESISWQWSGCVRWQNEWEARHILCGGPATPSLPPLLLLPEIHQVWTKTGRRWSTVNRAKFKVNRIESERLGMFLFALWFTAVQHNKQNIKTANHQVMKRQWKWGSRICDFEEINYK